ncbi:MAG TPA: secretin N-terminal domain-containing protein [Gemmatimonadaceae bacterium]|nr:secretin N-terminal domain-containing protein [Gemmatimonadaceae bacterium]
MRARRLLVLHAAGSLLVSCALASPALAQQPPATGSGARATAQGILVDFQDTELRSIITALAEAAGLNVTFGDLPSKRVTLRVRQPVPVDSVRILLRSLAESNGLRVTEAASLMRFEAPRIEPAPAPAVQQGSAVQLHVYRLRHARAARLAGTLQGIFGGGGSTEFVETQSVPLSQRLREQQIPPLRLDTMGRGRIEAAPQLPNVGRVTPGNVQIIPDENSNSLLVRASAADWAVISQAIEAVDLRPLQVLIEVTIAEVRRSRDLDVGVSGSATKRNAGGATRGKGTMIESDADARTGELLLEWMNGGSIDVTVALRALATRGDVRILSRPVLLAQNNQEARILVGSQRPFVQVFRSLPTETGVRDQIVQYKDVGTALTIVPTVNPDGYVNLQLTQEVSTATNETQFGAPVISTREAQTFLFVRDGQTTVIGGLIDRQSEKNRTGIPVLVNIPVLGALFGTTTNTMVRSELFLFLTPHVVRSDEELDRVRGRIENKLDLLRKELPAERPDSAPPAPPPAP